MNASYSRSWDRFAYEAAVAICGACGAKHGGVEVVATALERMMAAYSAPDPADLDNVKKVLVDYIRNGYQSGTTSSFVRDVLTALRDMPECDMVKDHLNAGVAKLVGC